MFKRKKNTVPTSRMARVMGEPSDNVSAEGIRPRARRKTTWAECHLSWTPDGLAHGIVMDYSDTGVRVRFNTRCALPSEVVLSSPRLRLKRTARVVRRDDVDVGFTFV